MSHFYRTNIPDPEDWQFGEPPSYSPMQLQSFVFTQGFSGPNYKVFSSKSSLDKYKSWKKLAPGSEGFTVAKQKQNLSIGLPLLICEKVSGFTSKFIRLYTGVSNPKARGRLYNSQDDRMIGHVYQRYFKNYIQYKMVLQDDNVIVLQHRILPIVDFSIDGNRFRILKRPITHGQPGDFMYELYLLGPNQTSLFDGWDVSGEIRKSNPLLEKKFLKAFSRCKVPDVSEFESPHSIGALEHSPSSKTFTTIREVSTFTTFTSAANQDSNFEVESRTLAFISVALIVQRIEAIRARNRRSSSSANFNSINNASMSISSTM